VLTTPLIFTSSTVEGFEFPKMIVIYIVGTTIIFLFLMTRTKKLIKPKTTPVMFILAYMAATLTSTHIYTSLWGYYSRFNGGLVSMLVYFGLYITALNLLNKTNFENIKKMMVITSIPVSLYGIFQHLVLSKDQGTVRIFSNIGQANWLGAYLAFCILIALGYMFSQRNWRLYLSAYSLGFLGLWLTFSVSSLLGLVGGLAVFTACNRGALVKQPRKAVAVATFSFLVIVFMPGIWQKRIEDVYKSITLVQTAHAQNTKQFNISDSGLIRKGMWAGSIYIITSDSKTFILGSGPETFAYVFQKHRPAFLNYTSEWEYILNKPHNYYLEIWTTTGLIGFTTYIALIFFAYKKVPLLIKPPFVALFIVNIFSWPTTVLNLFFWLLLADEQIN
jgi:O-antigen ligase